MEVGEAFQNVLVFVDVNVKTNWRLGKCLLLVFEGAISQHSWKEA